MQITIKLFSTLRIGRFSEEVRGFSGGTTIGQVINSLDIPDYQTLLSLVNGSYAKADSVLYEGDVLSLLPVVSGG